MSVLNYKPVPEWLEYAKTLPQPQMLLDSFWFEGELCFFFSDTGSGKTVLGFQIAQSIATGIPIDEFLQMNAQPQKVFVCEFELSVKQFESRFIDKTTGKTFMPSSNIIRAELNLENFDFKNDLENTVIQDIKDGIIKNNCKILIIDNLTYINDTNKFDQAIKFMQKMNKMKKELGLSILVLGHTPKRNLVEPITQNSMTGSKKLMDLSDSSFTLGKSSKGENIRYLKQIKVRQDALKYGSENVIDCELSKKDGFLSFHLNGSSPEYTHLKKPKAKDSRNSELIEDYKLGKYTQLELAEKYQISDRMVRNIINKYKDDEPPF